MAKLLADLSLDLDNKWSYLKTHGDPSWSSYPSYLSQVTPHILEILDELNLKITVFVVGQDAELEVNRKPLQSIVAAGHEIGNHSFQHEPWLHRYTPGELEREFDRAEEAITAITAQPLCGFRGPGYSLSPDVLELLHRRGYRFDASTLPTFIGPLARAYFFLKSNLSREQAEDRRQLFGSLRDGLRRLKPYYWRLSEGELLEIPVTTMPFIRAPFHFSYLLYLAQYSERLAASYFRLAIALCRMTRIGPSLLLHPLDFLGGDEVRELEFFPAMSIPGKRKRRFVSRILALYTRSFEVVSMGERAERLLYHSHGSLPRRSY